MADKVIIEVGEFTPHSGIAKGSGKPYTIYNLVDNRSGRKAKTFDGDWVKNWQNGDMVEVIWGDSSEYNGVTTWEIKNPNAAPKKPWAGRGQGGFGGGTNNAVHAMYVAATLMAPRNLDGKINLEHLYALADAIKAKLDADKPAAPAAAPAAAAPAPTQPAPAPTPVAPTPAPVRDTADLAVTVDEDDDKPF